MTALATRTIQKTNQGTKTLSFFQRIAEKDETAARDCINAYGDFIWALARKFTHSREEAEAATQEIFLDIWRYSKRADQSQLAENKLIAMIALRRLFKHLQ